MTLWIVIAGRRPGQWVILACPPAHGRECLPPASLQPPVCRLPATPRPPPPSSLRPAAGPAPRTKPALPPCSVRPARRNPRGAAPTPPPRPRSTSADLADRQLPPASASTSAA